MPLSDRLVARFSMTGQPDWMVADDRYLYVRQDSGRISAVDPRRNKVAWELDVRSDELCQGIGIGFGSLWTCSSSDVSESDDVVRIDLRSHKVVTKLPVGKELRQGHLVTGFGRVWIIRSQPSGSELVGIDPKTGDTDEPIPLGILASELAIDDTTVWAVSPTDNEVVGVDPLQHKVVRRTSGLGRLVGPAVLAVGNYLWVSGDKAVVGIDPGTGKVTVDIPEAAGGAGGMTASSTDLWLHAEGTFLTHIDATTGHVIERIVTRKRLSAGDMLLAFGSIWASANNESTLFRVRP